MGESLIINEIYLSLQGESTFAGLPCVFVRLTGCHLRCSYCDTAYAFGEGTRWEVGAVMDRVAELAGPYRAGCGKGRLPLVEVTGGEPLLQRGVLGLMKRLADEGYTVLLETSGALDVGEVDGRVHRIMDLKCPSSGEVGRNRWENLGHLRSSDEIKFVVGTVEDYEWMKRTILDRGLAGRCPLLVSWVEPLVATQRVGSLKSVPEGQTPIGRSELAERVVADALPVRFQLQLHKFIWSAERRGT
jgi:7-carboxy-7-deazaguanine synthase